MKIIKKILPILILISVLFYVIYFTEPPSSWQEASLFQILIFFIPLLLLFTFLANPIFSYLPKSFSFGLGLMMLVVLKSTDQLNIVTAAITIIATLLLIRIFNKPRFTRVTKIPRFRNLLKKR